MHRFSKKFVIDSKPVGEESPVYIIAEAGVSHFGSKEKAFQLVNLAVEAGADAVKFQIFDVDNMISMELPEWKDRLASRQLPNEAFCDIQRYCRKRNITFLATAHDEQSFDFLLELDVPAVKIGSGEVWNWPYLRRVAQVKKPVIISTGLYRLDEVNQALSVLADAGCRDVAVLHCVTRYPVPPSEAGLGNILKMRQIQGAVVGYSDHTKGIHFPIAAVALGAKVLEKHITLDFDVPNAQDWKVSCGPDDFPELVRLVREIEMGLNVNNEPMEKESTVWAIKSLVAQRDIKPGEVITAGDLTIKRPGTGIPPSDFEKVIGRRVKTDINKDCVIKKEFLE
jgi:N-acetylneuraminate synthase/N,N'-diacetyllegionaminate synthase